MNKTLLYAVLFASAVGLGTTSCTVRGPVAAGVTVTEPTLVEISPGVWVIEDYDDPVFYADGFYWLYRGDTWFRSTIHSGGWLRVDTAPRVVIGLGHPRAYIRYRATGRVHVRHGHRGNVIVRDHRPARGRDHRRGR
jgi:hypothetical protein